MKKITFKLIVNLIMIFMLMGCMTKKLKSPKPKSSSILVPMHKVMHRSIADIKSEKWEEPIKLCDLTCNGTYRVSDMNELIAYFLVDAELSEFDVDGSGCFGLHVDKYKTLIEDAIKRVRNDLTWIGYKDNDGNGIIFIVKEDMSFIFTIHINLETEEGIDWDGMFVYYNGYQHKIADSFATR